MAYPSAVIFVPSGQALGLGKVTFFAYEGVIFKQPMIAPWCGGQFGVLPQWSFGNKGLGFGGLELGFDAFQTAVVQPSFNAKLGLLRGVGWIPSVAIGYAGFAPTVMRYANNILYTTLTLNPKIGKIDLGRVHGGAGWSFNPDRSVTHGTWPFSHQSPGLILAGYETPSLGIAYLAADHFGGFSDFGSTNFALGLAPVPEATVLLGWTMSNVRATPYDGVFILISVTMEPFKRKAKAP